MSYTSAAKVRNRDIIVIGGSAGSLDALRQVAQSLPSDLNAAIFVTVHRTSLARADHLPWLLSLRSPLGASVVRDGERFKNGHIYVSPGEAELILEPEAVRVIPSKRHPPRTIDALFKSAAHVYAERVIGVVLSGKMDDGTAGCWDIRKHGGVTIAQDPGEAAFSSMPKSALRDAPVHYCLPAAEIAMTLKNLVAGASGPSVLQNARVMIVEDEWVLASELERQLSDLHYIPVATVGSGEQALETAEDTMPDVVIMDVGLAGKMKGTEAAALLWQRYGIPIIFLTAHADQQTITAAQPAMPYAFLTKPHNAAQLHAAIQLALARHYQGMRTQFRSDQPAK